MQSVQDYSPAAWRRLAIIRDRLERFLDRRGYGVVATPILEQTDLFLKKSGGELAARMFSFIDPSGHRVSLRPEFTSSVVRAFIDGTYDAPMPMRCQYCGPVFRYEGAQERASSNGSVEASGSIEFQQLGAEIIGAAGPKADAEVIALAVQGLTALGVKGHKLRIGHMGVVNAMLDGLGLSERARVFILSSFPALRSGESGMDDVRARATSLGLLGHERTHRLTELTRRMPPEQAEGMVEGFLAQGVAGLTGQRTPEEVFQRYLKKIREVGVPEIVEKALGLSAELVTLSGSASRTRGKLGALAKRFGLGEEVLKPLDDVLEALSQYELRGVPVVLDLGMARGIAYYTGVVFDIDHARIKNRPDLGGGGRYDGLVKALGGPDDLPALGFAYSLDRVSELLPADFGFEEMDGTVRVLVTAPGDGIAQAVATAERLRARGIPAELDLQGLSDIAAAKYARARGIQTVMRIGKDGDIDERAV